MADGATSGKITKRSFSEEFLTCAVCFELYRKPRQLKCLHSFCSPCLEAIIESHKDEQEFACPLCMQYCHIPPSGVDQFNLDFRLQNLLEYMEEENCTEEEVKEDKDGEVPNVLTVELEERIADALHEAIKTECSIDNHTRRLKYTEGYLDRKLNNLLLAVDARENEICKFVHDICQGHRETLKRERTSLHQTFQQEIRNMMESSAFLNRVYGKFKHILHGDEEVPDEPTLLQLDAIISDVSKEKFSVPHWVLPQYDCPKLGPGFDDYTLDLLVGTLTTTGEINNTDIDKTGSDDPCIGSRSSLDQLDKETYIENLNIDRQTEKSGSYRTAHGSIRDSGDHSEEELCDEDDASHDPSTKAAGHLDVLKFLKHKKHKKKKKCLAISYALLKNAPLALVACPVTAVQYSQHQYNAQEQPVLEHPLEDNHNSEQTLEIV